MYLFYICDVLKLTTTFPYHGPNRCSLQHFSHRLPLSWSMSTSPSLQDENLYWSPKNIMLTQRATQLTIPSSSLVWPDCYFRAGKTIMICAKVATDLATQDHSWGMANCMARYLGLMLSGLQYRFSPCRGDGVGINHYNGNLWLKCWSEYWSSPWCRNVLVSHSVSQIQSRQTDTHRCVQYDNKN